MEDKKHFGMVEEKIEFMPLSEAVKMTGYTPEYLNFLCRKKKLRAQKIGRNWHTKKEWVLEFLASEGEGEKEKVENNHSGNWLKILAVMSSAIIILPVLFAGSQMIKYSFTGNQKNSELAKIYSDNQNLETKIFNENTGSGKVAGEQTTQTKSNAVLTSANFKINSINVGGNILILSNENNKALQIENIKSDSFADNKKNETSLVVSWQTNKLAISELDYAKNDGQNPETISEDSYGFSHSAVITGLEPRTPYVFQIKSKDRWANEFNSDFFGVYTASKPISVFDLISNAVGDVFGWVIKK